MTLKGTSAERTILAGDAAAAEYLAAAPKAQRAMLREARKAWRTFRSAEYGYVSHGAILTPPEAQPKTGKSATRTLALMLAPASMSGVTNVCPAATAGCRAACLNTAGHGDMTSVQTARVCRTRFVLAHPAAAMIMIAAETLRDMAKGPVALRLNCTSDVRWEIAAPQWTAAMHAAGVTFYDYTAWAPRMRTLPTWWDITYSAKETHDAAAIVALAAAGRVAVVFSTPKGQALPTTWHGVRVIDGDVSDYRPADDRGVIVGLRAKGQARGDDSGFVFSPLTLPLPLAA